MFPIWSFPEMGVPSKKPSIYRWDSDFPFKTTKTIFWSVRISGTPQISGVMSESATVFKDSAFTAAGPPDRSWADVLGGMWFTKYDVLL